MSLGRKIFVFLWAALVLRGQTAGPVRVDPGTANNEPNTRVILLANSADPDSLRIARHYAEVRGVPAGNIFSFAMPLSEEISWAEFISQVWQPLQDALVAARWIDGIAMASPASGLRRRYAMNGHRLAALVVCRGVPLKIRRALPGAAEARPTSRDAELQTSAAAVDSELILLAHNPYDAVGIVDNPLFQNIHPSTFDRGQVIAVGRLDGPSADDALALVDRALAAERDGIVGRAYVDLSGRHADGDRWLESVAAQTVALGFETEVDRHPDTMSTGTRADAALFYFGWYSENIDGPFALTNYRFPAGAIALHIHSFSARTLHSATEGWSGPLVAHGATVTFGNVYEPYLQLTVRPDLFLRAVARGANAGEAYLFATPALSWQGILVGDPLYRPFARGLKEQWEKRASLTVEARGYLALREINLAESGHRETGGENIAKTAWQETPTLALGMTLSSAAEKRGDVADARVFLERALPLPLENAANLGLLHEAAVRLAALGDRKPALDLFRRLFSAEMPGDLRARWLDEAFKVARETDPVAAENWAKERDQLFPPTRK